MQLDPLHHPIAALTDHCLLTAAEEAGLIATIRAGGDARAQLQSAAPPDVVALQQQVAQGDHARATLFRHNLRLVVSFAKRYLPMAGDHLSLDDLISFGSIGLLHGIDRFNPARKVRLSTYATWWIRQAIGRGIADEGRTIGLPVHVHERLSQQRKARNRLNQQLGREPSLEELAAELHLRPQQVAQLDRVSQETRSLNTKVRSTDDRVEIGDLLPDQRFDPEAAALQTSVRADLVTALARCLTDREQRFLRAYLGFDTGQKTTLEAIGQHEGLTRERVRQVIAEALAKLRADPSIRAYAPAPE